MRIACVLLIAMASLCSGCSAFIGCSGKDLTALKTREEIHAVLGEPAVKGGVGEESFEEYCSRRKIAEDGTRRFGMGYGMIMGMTLGTAELLLTPFELYLVGKRTLLGQTIRVTYDATGQVTGQFLDGESLSRFGFRRTAPPDEGGQVNPAPALFPAAAAPPPPPVTPAR